MAMRKATPEEWAANIFKAGATQEMVAQAIAASAARGRMHERRACADLAREHAHNLTEGYLAELPIGATLTDQQLIDVAAEMRHAAQYVGALIAQRDQPTERII